jgi:hypothetical protein
MEALFAGGERHARDLLAALATEPGCEDRRVAEIAS